MPIETICQGCSKKLRVADEHAGKQARCPGCGNIYVVPQPTPSSYSPFASTPTSAPASPVTVAVTTALPEGGNLFADPPAKDIRASEQWFIRIEDGREFGPVDRPTLDSWFRERRIGPTTQLKRESDGKWQPASYVYPELGGPANYLTTTGSTNPFADQPQYSGPSPYPGNTVATSYVEPHRGGLILALAIISWFVCVFLAIAAWVMAAEDLKKMRNGRMDNSGYGLTQAGMIIAIIQIVLIAATFGLLFLLMIVGAMN